MKRIIVFDSSTLILLAKITLLREVANRSRCIITNVVEDECTRKETFDSKIIRELIEENLIEIECIKPKELAKIRKDFNIEEGEASSLALAMKEKAILAADDKPTMKACTILNIDFSTAIHFIVRAYKRRLIDKKIALEKLSDLEKYGRYSAQIIEDAKHRIEGD